MAATANKNYDVIINYVLKYHVQVYDYYVRNERWVWNVRSNLRLAEYSVLPRRCPTRWPLELDRFGPFRHGWSTRDSLNRNRSYTLINGYTCRVRAFCLWSSNGDGRPTVVGNNETIGRAKVVRRLTTQDVHNETRTYSEWIVRNIVFLRYLGWKIVPTMV